VSNLSVRTAVCVGVFTLAATACSGSSGGGGTASSAAPSDSGASSATPSATTNAAAVTAEAMSRAAAALVRPTEIGLTTPLPKKAPTGKNIYFVQCAVPECALISEYVDEGAKLLGWNVHKVVVTAQSAEALAAAWNKVADAHPDGVISNGAPVAAIAGALAKLSAAHVPVVEFATPDAPGKGLTASLLSKPYVETRGATMADFIAADSGGNANVAFFTANAFPIDPPEVAAFQAELPKACPGCSLAVHDVDATTIGTKLPSIMAAYIRSHPKLTYIYGSFDSMFIGVPQALAAAGVPNQVKLVSGDPSPLNVSFIKSGKEFASYAYPTGEVVYRSLDFLARTFLGAPTAPSTDAPFPFFVLTKAAVQDAQPANGRFDAVIDYANQYKKLWLIG
jgi:ribose transport system substrate-binding protein